MDNTIRHEIMTRLSVPVWPTAGKALGFKTKTAAWAAKRRGEIPTIEGVGKHGPVPTSWLKRVLQLEEATDADA